MDNTFLTPYLSTPLAEGADISLYIQPRNILGGHNDVLAGVVTVKLNHSRNSCLILQHDWRNIITNR
ncbi:PLP-dependent transferase [Staphylococcus aureus]